MNRTRVNLFTIAAALAAFFMPVAANAGQTSVGAAVVLTHGTHIESSGAMNAPLVPAPIFVVRHTEGRWEFVADALPPIGAVPVANNGLGIKNISLTYDDAFVRYWNRRRTFAVGFGETLYNQRTMSLDWQSGPNYGDEYGQSRVAGARYELTQRIPLRLNTTLEFYVAADPSMHGRIVYEREDFVNGRRYVGVAQPLWETASQIDTAVRIIRRYGPMTFSYGIRYIDYTALLNNRFYHGFADKNAFVMPFVGIERRVGR